MALCSPSYQFLSICFRTKMMSPFRNDSSLYTKKKKNVCILLYYPIGCARLYYTTYTTMIYVWICFIILIVIYLLSTLLPGRLTDKIIQRSGNEFRFRRSTSRRLRTFVQKVVITVQGDRRFLRRSTGIQQKRTFRLIKILLRTKNKDENHD